MKKIKNVKTKIIKLSRYLAIKYLAIWQNSCNDKNGVLTNKGLCLEVVFGLLAFSLLDLASILSLSQFLIMVDLSKNAQSNVLPWTIL